MQLQIFIKKKGKDNICQELYSYNSVQLIFIKHLLCAKHPIKQWEAMIYTQMAQIEPSQLFKNWVVGESDYGL